ncbi:MAG: hypothetical protein ACO1N6_08620 [Microcella sp.]
MNGVDTFDVGWTLVPVLVLIGGFVGGVLLIALLLWILYTIIWNGVRRGLEEYYGPAPRRPEQRARHESVGQYFGFVDDRTMPAEPDGGSLPTPSPMPSPAQPMVRERRHRSGRLTR